MEIDDGSREIAGSGRLSDAECKYQLQTLQGSSLPLRRRL